IAELELDEPAQARAHRDDGVDGTSIGHGIRVVAAAEGHRVEREATDGDLAAKVVGVRADLTDAVDPHVADEEVGSRVARPAGLETGELEREPRRQRVGLDLGVHPERGDRSHAAEASTYDTVEPIDEFRDAL